MTKWPSSFPCPQIAGHSAEAYAAVIRTPFQGGNTRQRRIHTQLPNAINLSWVIKQSEFGLVLTWMNVNAWDWFEIDIPGPLAGLNGVATYPHNIRFIGDLRQELIYAKDGYHWRVAVTAEWVAAHSELGPAGEEFLSHKWIIAGTPRNPSAPDWIIAGDPIRPSDPDVYTAGTPRAPAALV